MTKKNQIPEGKKVYRYRVQFDIGYIGDEGKEMDQANNTQPDMHLTVRQLLENHSRGIPLPHKEPLHFDTMIPQISDITDVERYRDHLKSELEQSQKFIDQYDEDQEIKKLDANRKAKQKEIDQMTLDDPPEKEENK